MSVFSSVPVRPRVRFESGPFVVDICRLHVFSGLCMHILWTPFVSVSPIAYAHSIYRADIFNIDPKIPIRIHAFYEI